MAIIEDLTRMKTKIESAKIEAARLEGSLADKMKRLKELGYDNVDAADKALAELRDKIAELDDKIQRGVEELRAEYGL